MSAEEIPDLALLLEALRIFRNHALTAIRVAPEGSAARRECERALAVFDRAVPRVEVIRNVSSYFGHFLSEGERKVRGGGLVSHNQLEYNVTIDDETLTLSHFRISLKGEDGFSISVLACCGAAEELADSVAKAFGLRKERGA